MVRKMSSNDGAILDLVERNYVSTVSWLPILARMEKETRMFDQKTETEISNNQLQKHRLGMKSEKTKRDKMRS